jgi:hypothetical protein
MRVKLLIPQLIEICWGLSRSFLEKVEITWETDTIRVERFILLVDINEGSAVRNGIISALISILNYIMVGIV